MSDTELDSKQMSARIITGSDFAKIISDLSCPVLNIGDKRGHSDYIDFISETDVSAPIMKGVDISSRPFITVKIVGKKENNKKKKFFQTFFQRYSDEKTLWMGCGNCGLNLIYTTGGMKDSDFQLLTNIIIGKECKLYDYPDVFFRDQRLVSVSVETVKSKSPVM